MYKMKKITAASILLASLIGGNALAANDEGTYVLKMRVDAKSELPQWLTINYIYGTWANVGGNYACQAWSPLTSTIDWGQSFQQTRSCSQNQDRDVTPVMMSPVTREVKNGETFTGSRVVSVSQFQPAVGARDFIVSERPDAWSAWLDQGNHYDCDTWSPATETVNLYDPFTQNRDCSQNQTRTRQVYNVWASGKETPKRVDSEDQTISETESRSVQGSKDYISGQRAGAWAAWSNDGAPYDCAVWSPDVATVNLDQDFTQSRNCKQNQDSSREIYDVWRSGTETLNHVEPRAQTVTVGQTQTATGTKDYITATRNANWTAWVDSGAHYACTTWTPAKTTINLGEAFTQSRDCSQNQTRQRDVMNVWKSGKKTVKNTESGAQTVTVNSSRSATGTKNIITGSSAGSWSAWSNSGGLYSCGGYSPSTSTVNYGTSFTQYSTCSRNQTRSRTIYNVWTDGSTTYKSTENASRVVGATQSRSATGSSNYVTGTSSGGWSSWSNSGGVYGCGSYSPATSTVNYGSSFTQHSSCSRNQVRSRTIYYTWANGSTSVKSNESDSRVVSATISRSATGTKNEITGSQSTTGAWSNNGSLSCGSYSPSTSTVNLGSSFTQSRSCSQPQKSVTTTYNVWSNGSKTVKSTSNNYRTVSSTQSRSATGTKDYVLTYDDKDYFTTYSSWSCGSWSPSANRIPEEIQFTQTRSCSRTKYNKYNRYALYKSGKRVLQASNVTTSSSAESKTESRTMWGEKLKRCGDHFC